MIKQIKKHGNSHAIVVDKPIMQALGINAETDLQLVVSNGSLIITPVHLGIGREGVSKALEELRPKYDSMLKKLAE